MFKLVNESRHIVFTLSTLTIMVSSSIASADIYKWRDARGVVQYSNTVPTRVTEFTKASQDEVVNSFQKRDVCSGSSSSKRIKAEGAISKSKSTALIKLNDLTLPELNFISTAEAASFDGTSLFSGHARIPRLSSISFAEWLRLRYATPAPAPKPAPAPAPKPAPAPAPKPAPAPAPKPAPAPAPKPAPAPAPKPAPAPAPKPAPAPAPKPAPAPAPKPAPAPAPKPAPAPAPKPAPAPAPAPKPAPAPAPKPAPAPAPKPAPVPAPAPAPAPVGANIIQQGLMPAIDIGKNIAPALGFSMLRVNPANEQPIDGGSIGAFRVKCEVSHMSNDDPLVFPNQQNATHHHTFYGNTTINYKSDLSNLPSVGNSTCDGGIMNRSAYWHPTLIDTTTNTAVLPVNNEATFYYKTGYRGVSAESVTVPPKGLRILTGNSKATTASAMKNVRYACGSNGAIRYDHIPNCAVGDSMLLEIFFPQCWDGKNLDSPNHQDHMANANNGCPASHPVPIPEITLNMYFRVTKQNQGTTWRLSSDNYAFNGSNAGYSGHADWVNGWDDTFIRSVVKNCLNARKDCKAHLLGDGRTYY